MSLLTRLDRLLLDAVFQRLANKLEFLAEPPALAESCLLGAAVMTLGQVAIDVRTDGLDPGTLFFGALNLAGAVWLIRWYRAHGGLSRGMANPLREMPIWSTLRLFSLLDVGLSIGLPLLGIRSIGTGPFAVPVSSGTQSDIFAIAASVLSTAGLYFAACTKPPPNARVRTGAQKLA